MINFSFFNIFKKKKEQVGFPHRFALIRYSNHAKDKAIYDDENKIIEIYKKGELIETHQYSAELVNALEEVDEIPVEEEKFEEEDFEFQEVANFGSVSLRR